MSTEKAVQASIEKGERRRSELLEEVKWLLDGGCNAWEMERAFPNSSLTSLERTAYRNGDKQLAARIHRLVVDARIAA